MNKITKLLFSIIAITHFTTVSSSIFAAHEAEAALEKLIAGMENVSTHQVQQLKEVFWAHGAESAARAVEKETAKLTAAGTEAAAKSLKGRLGKFAGEMTQEFKSLGSGVKNAFVKNKKAAAVVGGVTAATLTGAGLGLGFGIHHAKTEAEQKGKQEGKKEAEKKAREEQEARERMALAALPPAAHDEEPAPKKPHDAATGQVARRSGWL